MQFVGGSSPSAVAVDGGRRRLYVVSSNDGTVAVVDTASGTRLATLPVGSRPNAIVFDDALNRAYVVSDIGGVFVIDAAALTVQSTPITTQSLRAVAVDASLGRLYISNGSSVQVLDATTFATIATLNVGGLSLAVDRADHRLYVGVDSAVVVVDAVAAGGPAVLTSVPMGGRFVTGLAIDQSRHRLLASNSQANAITVVDTTTDAPVTSASVGPNPAGIGFDPLTNLYFVALLGGSRGVGIVDGSTYGLLGTLPAAEANAVAVDGINRCIYVANGGFNTVLSFPDSGSPAGNPPPFVPQPCTTAGLSLPTIGMAYGVAIDASANRLVVGDDAHGTLSVLDTVTSATLAVVPTGGTHLAVAVNPTTHRIYVTNPTLNVLHVIDETTKTLVATVALNNPRGVAVNSVTNRIYVGGYGGVGVFDGDTNQQLAFIPANVIAGLAVDQAANRIYLSGDGSVGVLDGATNTLLTSIPTARFQTAVAIDPSRHRIYSVGAGVLQVTDTVTFATISTLSVPNVRGLALNALTNRLYLAAQNPDTLQILDASTLQLQRSLPIANGDHTLVVNPATSCVYASSDSDRQLNAFLDSAPGVPPPPFVAQPCGPSPLVLPMRQGPIAVDVNPLTRHLYVVNRDANSVTVIDADTSGLIAVVPVGASPRAVAVNPTTNRVYVVNTGDNSVAVIDGSTNRVQGTIPVAGNPLQIAVNRDANLVYVSRGDGRLSVLDGGTNAELTQVQLGLSGPVVVDPERGRIFVAGDGQTAVIDAATNTPLVSISDPRVQSGIGVDPVRQRLYAASASAAVVTVRDTLTDALLGTFTVTGQPRSLALDAIHNRLYVPTVYPSALLVLDASTGRTLSSTPLQDGDHGVAVNPTTACV
jgi:YVTN family beta-propeller protein